MNGGKDVKIGHDKRPVSVVPNDEQPLFNINNGQRLIDEFGNPLVTKVDQFFVADTSSERSTSVVFPEKPSDKYFINNQSQVGSATVTYGNVLHVDTAVTEVGFSTNSIPVLQVGGGIVGAVGTVKKANNSTVSLDEFPNHHEVGLVNPISGNPKYLHFTTENESLINNLRLGDLVVGHNIGQASIITKLKPHQKKIQVSKIKAGDIVTGVVKFIRKSRDLFKSDNVLKVAEVFKETSEVSTTLLGIPRAEVQLSLFSNVSSYGLNKDDWETYTYNSGSSKLSWEERVNATYGKKYRAKIEEETQESAIKLSAFPVPFSFPYGIQYKKIRLYNPTYYEQYVKFINLGNAAYNYYSGKSFGTVPTGYSSSYADNFLNPDDVKVDDSGEVVYSKIDGKPDDFTYAFSKIDIWTDTWRLLSRTQFIDPVQNKKISTGDLIDLLAGVTEPPVPGKLDTLRAGYSDNFQRFTAIQSRRVFRYQPGRISGFTFGLRSSKEQRDGCALEWGIANETDQYLFNVYAGRLSIIRRSTVALSDAVLRASNLDPIKVTNVRINGKSYSSPEFNAPQPIIPSGDPFDVDDEFGPYNSNTKNEDELARARKYYTIRIDRDDFNGDSLDGNGPSGYNIQVDNVTMWKIEFGWYGAIGARFYAYIPAGPGEARWVVIHTLVIENQLGEPCLRDSYFRFKYSLRSVSNATIFEPQFLYKYGASYYIDGGDEGTSQVYSVNTGLSPKAITSNERTLFGIRPREIFTSISGSGSNEKIDEIANRKLILPTKINLSSDILSEVKVRTCTGCQGHAHVFTPGVQSGMGGSGFKFTNTSGYGVSSREIKIKFAGNTVGADPNSIEIISDDKFSENDIGSKIIAPSLFNLYIDELSGTAQVIDGKKYYKFAIIRGFGPGLDAYPDKNKEADVDAGARNLIGTEVKDYGQGGTVQLLGTGDGTYPHIVRLSSYNDVHFSSDQELSGSEIKIQFLNPRPKDGISSYRSNTHWSDFMIGVTDQKPNISSGELEGWNIAGVTTTILPNQSILFGESTHSWAGMNEDGVEEAERWAPVNYRVRMGEDIRTPVVPEPAGGVCSSVKIEVSESITLGGGLLFVSIGNNKDPNDDDVEDGDGTNYFLLHQTGEPDAFASVSNWKGGQVVYEDADGEPNDGGANPAVYSQEQPSVIRTGGTYFTEKGGQFIRISNTMSFQNNQEGIKLLGKTVTLVGSRLDSDANPKNTKTKLFTYKVYPLYLVGKLRDNSKINNIMITETSSTGFKKTTSPKLCVSKDSNGSIITINATNDSTPPPSFDLVDRLSAATVDNQNLRVLRESTVRDTFYIGQDETKEVDLTKIFNIDRNVITPDNSNIEATFITAKGISTSKNNGEVQGSLNFKEQ